MSGEVRQQGGLRAAVAIAALALALRLAGLFRGAHDEFGYQINPDVPKQVIALELYLQGQYVRYVGTPAYDGYPFGLNRLDEVILRPWLALERGVVRGLTAGESAYRRPDRPGLIRRMLVLRALYSLLSLLACGYAARVVWRSHGAAVVTLMAMALSPVCLGTAHMASGDVGAELGVSLALAALAAHVRRPSWGRLFAAGAAVGFGFACKFNAALVAAALLFYTIGAAGGASRLRDLLRAGLAQGVGFLLGAAAFTPALFVNPARTLRDIWRNFGYIQAYGAPAGFFERPIPARVAAALGDNLPRVPPALGLLILVFGFAAWLLFLRRPPLPAAGEGDTRRAAAFTRALTLFVPLALLLAMVGKPDAQPFHFSPMMGPIALLLGALWVWRPADSRGGWPRRIARLFVWLALIELAARAWPEVRRWSREDSRRVEAVADEVLLRPDAWRQWPSRPFRSLHLEGHNPSVFRNSRRWMPLPGGDLWRDMGVLPVPDLPHPRPTTWLIADGGVLPRNDRHWTVHAGETSRRTLVRYDADNARPSRVILGLRAGRAPVAVAVQAGDVKQSLMLNVHTQAVVTLAPLRWRRIDGRDKLGRSGQCLDLEIAPQIGAVHAVLLDTPLERGAFQLWGGEDDPAARQAAEAMRALDPRALDLVSMARYLEGADSGELVDAGRHDRWRLLADDRMVLAAGRYRVSLDVEVVSERARLRLPEWLGPPDEHAPRELERGLQRIIWTFQKPAFPLACVLPINVVTGEVRFGAWTLDPDAAGLRADLNAWLDRDIRPRWLAPRAPDPTPPPGGWREETALLTYGGWLASERIHLPAEPREGRDWIVRWPLSVRRPDIPHIHEYRLVLHAVDSAGGVVWGDEWPLEPWMAGRFVTLDRTRFLPAGEYALEAEVRNDRTRKRLPVTSADPGARIERGKRARLATVRVTAEAASPAFMKIRD